LLLTILLLVYMYEYRPRRASTAAVTHIRFARRQQCKVSCYLTLLTPSELNCTSIPKRRLQSSTVIRFAKRQQCEFSFRVLILHANNTVFRVFSYQTSKNRWSGKIARCTYLQETQRSRMFVCSNTGY